MSGRDEAAIPWWKLGSPMASAPALANLERHDRTLPGGEESGQRNSQNDIL